MTPFDYLPGTRVPGVSRPTSPFLRTWVPGLLLGVALAVGSVESSVGQAAPAGVLPAIIPPSPTAAALEKYGQVPVSTYTGVPNISVPLYEIKVRDLAIPLSLSYHAGGFRVGEEASWVGLGWSLQAGSSITRTVRGLDDLIWFIPRSGHNVYTMPEPTGAFGCLGTAGQPAPSICQNGDPYTGIMAFMNDGFFVYTQDPTDSTKSIQQNYGQQGVLTDPNVDWEPDDFRFTAGSSSGQFAFDQKGRIHILEQQKIAIVPPSSTDPYTWKLTTSDGSQYFYGAFEQSGGAGSTAITAWYLTRMRSPSGEEARFTYVTGSNVTMQPQLAQSETKQYTDCGGYPPSVGYSAAISINGLVPQYLSRIDFATGYVVFERDESTSREDLQGAQRLQRIVVYSQTGEVQKEFALQTSYFEAPAASAGFTTPSANNAQDLRNDYERKRLRLDAVVEKDRLGKAKPATSFLYNATALPVKSSYSVDFWGYYNGRANTTLIPRYAGNDLNNSYVSYQGADRTPDAAAMQANVLQQITYPTGGKTTFTFEPHDYGGVTDEDIQTSTVLTTPVLGFKADNADPQDNRPTTYFTVTENTPLTLTKYDLWVANANNKKYTYLSLIDDKTGKPFTSGTPGYTNYFVATWYFPDTNSTSNDPTAGSPSGNPYTYSYYNYTNNPNRVTGNIQFVVPAGSYHFEALLPNCSAAANSAGQCQAIVEVQGYYSQLQTVTALQANNLKLLAGGLRVARIEDTDGLPNSPTQVRVYQYSPGTLMSVPAFKKISPVPNESNGPATCRSLKLSSSSFTAFSAGAKGASVGYSQVDVLLGAQGEGGKTSYFYHNQADRRVQYGDRQPNVPSRADDLNGYLLSQKTYRKVGTDYQLLTATENTYEVVNQYNVPAIFRGEKYLGGTTSSGQRLYYYQIPSRCVRLVSTVSRQYDPLALSNVLTTGTRYTYDTLRVGHMQVSQTRTRRSDGSVVVKTITYPADYTAVGNGFLAQMRSMDCYQHSAPIETSTRVYGPAQTLADAVTVTGSYTEYTQPTPTSRYFPSTISHLELARPSASLPLFAPTLPPATRYVPQQRLYYHSQSANLQQAQLEKGSPTAYLWGYGNTLPIAEVKNAAIAEVLHENFEEQPAWDTQLGYDGSLSHTGRVAATMTPAYIGHMLHSFATRSLTVTLAAPKRYLLSGWVYTTGPTAQLWLFKNQPGSSSYYDDPDPAYATTDVAGKWVYLQQVVTVPAGTMTLTPRLTAWCRGINTPGQVWFDDLRLHPLDAQMTTLTHEPLVGVTSVSDATSRPTYYEYDALGRLLRVKDEQGRVRTRQDYHYAGQ